VEWRVEPVESDPLAGLRDLGGREIAMLLASAYGRIRALELELAARRR
jgi:hypothetical protein